MQKDDAFAGYVPNRRMFAMVRGQPPCPPTDSMKPSHTIAAFALVLVAGIGIAAVSGVFRLPATTFEHMEAAHDAHGSLDSRLTSYVDGYRIIGLPFRSTRLRANLDRIRGAQRQTIWVEGVELTPWQSIVTHDAGPELVDSSVTAVERVVMTANETELRSRAARDAAVAYLVARQASSESPTRSSTRAAADAALALARAIERTRESLPPLAEATRNASAVVDGAAAWSREAIGEPGAETEVLTTIRNALGALATVLQIPDRHFDDVSTAMAADAETLLRVAEAGGASP